MEKTNIIELIKIFGLEIDYDRWLNKNKRKRR